MYARGVRRGPEKVFLSLLLSNHGSRPSLPPPKEGNLEINHQRSRTRQTPPPTISESKMVACSSGRERDSLPSRAISGEGEGEHKTEERERKRVQKGSHDFFVARASPPHCKEEERRTPFSTQSGCGRGKNLPPTALGRKGKEQRGDKSRLLLRRGR